MIDVYFLSHFSIKCLCANRNVPDGTPASAASHLSGAMLLAYVP